MTNQWNQGKVTLKYLLISSVFAVVFGMSYDFWSMVGIGISVFVFLNYISHLNLSIPVLELMLFISALQWIVGAHQAFNFEFQHDKYYMYVEREQYMGTIVPGFIAFVIGILIVKRDIDIQEVNRKMIAFVLKNPRAPLILIAIGFVSPFIQRIIPSEISFIFYLTANLKYIGTALWLFQPNSARRWIATAGIMFLTLLSSIQAGMFHDLLLWLALLFSFIVLQTKMALLNRLLFISLGFFLAFMIQSVKGEYRVRLYESLVANRGQTPAEIFMELIDDRIENLGGMFSSEDYMAEMNIRLNQGWIISAIIENVPNVEPYANGETIVEAVRASLLPRFLDPEKKIAGGRENFERFTGLPLGQNASMGTSVIGEAYANFGAFGSWIFMFFWGVFLSIIFNLLVRYGEKQPLMYVFIPLIFLQVVKAETELYVVLNHFLKSLILVFGLLWVFKKYFGWKYEEGKKGDGGSREIRGVGRTVNQQIS